MGWCCDCAHHLCNEKGMYFSFNFGWYSIQLDIVCKEQEMRVFLVYEKKSIKHDKIYLSMLPATALKLQQ